MPPPEMQKKKAKHLLFLAQSVVNNELNLRYANSYWGGEEKKRLYTGIRQGFLISVFLKSHILARIKIEALFTRRRRHIGGR